MGIFNASPSESLQSWVEEHRKQVDSQNVPIDGQTVVPDPPEASVPPVVEEVQTEQVSKTEETPKAEEQEEQPKSWDADEVIAEAPKSIFDLKSIGSALQLGELKDESELIAKVSDLVAKKKELEEKPLEGVPEDFRDVLEVAKRGESWKDYLSNQIIDFTKVDPIQLYEDSFFNKAKNDQRYFTDGKYDESKAIAALDSIPEEVQEQFGLNIQQAKIAQQNQRKAEIRAKAEARLTQADTTLSKATQNLSEILPFDNYGIKFEPKHSVEIYKGITDSTLTKKHLGVSYEKLVESGADMRQIARTITLAEKGEKMVKFVRESSVPKAKKEILASTQNVQLQGNGTVASPENPGAKVLSPAEKLAKHYANQNKSLFG